MKYFEFDEEDFNMKDDKIINNSYNSGDIEYESFTQPMKVDDRVSDLYSDTISDNIVEERTNKVLDEKIYELFKQSPFYEKYKNPKRVDKNDLVKMYYYFKERLLKEKTFSSTQIFIGFAEFFQINYDQLYSEVGVLDKEGLLRELNEKFNLNRKIKT
ncbi:MAG: hypothetical protein GYA51_01820, partial [Candidatus Methanofastidiosa archaeon]|nr:hypothetical protein [Candidatus Methanofastidiosa archaeon]